MKKIYFLGIFSILLISSAAQNVATFDDIPLETNTFWNGSDGSGGFFSAGFWFPNSFNVDWQSWSGFSVSNRKDSLTAGHTNQYSAITATGYHDSENYAVVYINNSLEIDFEHPVQVDGFYATNDTYTYLSMKNGDDFTKKFGGSDGNDPDYLKLIITGIDNGGNEIGTVNFFLADFLSESSGADYIVNEWKWVDLTALGSVAQLKFQLESTDVGDWGMNTPAYFCMDNFTASFETGISQKIMTDKLNLWPNPVKNDFFIDLPLNAKSLFLIDISGKIIFQQQFFKENKIKISFLSESPAGIYLLKIKTDSGYIQQKVVKI